MDSIKELMTIEEVVDMFGYSQNSIKKNFKRTAEAIKKKYNIDLVKCTTKDGTRYQIFEDTRALTIYQETDDIFITLESLSYEEYEFYIFLAVAASPFSAFRGKREDLLKYIGIKDNKKILNFLNSVFDFFVEKECIGFMKMEILLLYI